MNLKESQKKKLDNLVVEQMSEKKITEMLNTWKVIQGEASEKEFQYEYDELFDEMEEVCKISLEEFKNIAPKIYKKIGNTEGNKIYQGIKKKLLTDGLTLEANVKNKIEKIEKNRFLDDEKKKSIIANRKAMLKEANKLEEKGVKLDSNIAWKIWRIEEGKRAKGFIPENNLEKDLAVINYLGEEFIKELKAFKFGDDDEE